MKHRLVLWFALLIGVLPFGLRAQTADEKYLFIYTMIQEADHLSESGKSQNAAAKYVEAQAALKTFQSGNPGWNDKIVNYRLDYLSSKIEGLAKFLPQSAVTNAATAQPSGTQPEVGTGRNLPEELARVTRENDLLKAKLREALSVQPAALDPAELSKAMDKIKALEKERDLLRITLDQEQSKNTKPTDPSAVLSQEKQILAETKRRLEEQTTLVASLQRENQLLKNQLVEAKSAILSPGSTPSEELRISRVLVAALTETNISLRTERILLENKLAELSSKVVPKDMAKALEEERDEYKRRLAAANKELARRKGLPDSMPDELARQLDVARARLEVYESSPAPYSAEELAFFKAEPKNSTPDTNIIKQPRIVELPAGAAPLFAAAQHAFEAGRLDEAEKDFREVLRQDEKNTRTLVSLAAVQIEQNHLPDAEETLKKALAVDPQDPATLLYVGKLKYRQNKFDDALTALTQAAQIRPDDGQIQFWLGRTLVQKGNRSQAEKALRKAVQSHPGWGEAHYQLAVVYATQKPPFKELAQWHYQRALQGGYQRDSEFEKLIEDKTTAAK